MLEIMDLIDIIVMLSEKLLVNSKCGQKIETRQVLGVGSQ
jgi:hypothetical protein